MGIIEDLARSNIKSIKYFTSPTPLLHMEKRLLGRGYYEPAPCLGRSPSTIIVIFHERSKNPDHLLAGVYNRITFKPKKILSILFSHSICTSSMIMSTLQ